jgi:diacylglycerol kinase (ATP)
MMTYLYGRIASFKPAFAGIAHVFRTQPNIWVHTLISIAVILLGLWLGLELTQWALIVLAMGLVWVAEFINSALEAAIDLVSPDHHDLARVAKDASAAAVVLAALAAVILGGLVLGPLLWVRLFGG